MFCWKCGSKMDDWAQFCPSCGAPAQEPQQNQSAQQPYTQQYGQQPYGQPYQPGSAVTRTKNNYRTFDALFKAGMILAVASALCYLCSINLYYDWLAFPAAAALAVLCLWEGRYDTPLMAIPLSVLMLKEFIYFFVTTAPYLQYLPSEYTAVSVISLILETAIPVIYWLVTIGIIRRRKAPVIAMMILMGLLILGLLYVLTIARGVKFQGVMHQLGAAFFFGAYVLLVLSGERRPGGSLAPRPQGYYPRYNGPYPPNQG